MPHLSKARSFHLIEYFHDEVPWELERLESIDRLVSSGPDWAAARPDPRHRSYSSWLRETYGIFHRRAGLDGAA